MPHLSAMILFAATLSLAPGPVNVLTLSTGLNHGATRAMPFVTGATVSFTLLLLMVGLGLGSAAQAMGIYFNLISVLGAGLIAWFGVKLATSTGAIEAQAAPVPSFWHGAMLQILNPKAWGACIAAVAMFNLQDSRHDLLVFVVLYGVICFFGIGAWAVFGQNIRRFLNNARRLRLFNAGLGVTLIALAGFLLWQSVLTAPA